MGRNAGLRATDWTGQSVGTENPGLSGTTGQVKTGNLIWKGTWGATGNPESGGYFRWGHFFQAKNCLKGLAEKNIEGSSLLQKKACLAEKTYWKQFCKKMRTSPKTGSRFSKRTRTRRKKIWRQQFIPKKAYLTEKNLKATIDQKKRTWPKTIQGSSLSKKRTWPKKLKAVV